MSAPEESIDRVIAEYLQALEAGNAPARDDLLAAHPRHADRLAAFLDDCERLNRLGSDLGLTMPPEEAGPSLPALRYVGDYELLEEIARGGMGVVYRARQASLNRPVAVKMILSGIPAEARDLLRFKAEAEAAANLDHPGIVPIYEIGEHEGRPYFSMKLVEGGSLADRLPELRKDLRAGAAVLAKVARAVHFAHQRGILHRDLKPTNVLMDAGGGPCVGDFGLARRVETDSGLTTPGAIVGTPSYMAPEQARAEKGLTTAADVYSLGAILYELLAGRPPFREANQLETVLAVMNREPPRPSQVAPGVPRDLETVALKCLRKEPTQRYESAALADELERWLRGEPILARPASRFERARKWARRNPAVAALSASMLVLLTTGAAVTAAYQIRLWRALTRVGEVEEEAGRRLGQAKATQQWADYVGAVDRAAREHRDGWPGRADDALDRHLAYEGRAWEWHYLKRQGNRALAAFPGGDCMAWTPDGERVAVGGQGAVRFHDAASGKPAKTLTLGGTFVWAMALSRDGRTLAANVSGPGYVACDTADGKVRKLLEDREALAHVLALSPDGKSLAYPLPDKGAKIVDVATGKVLRVLEYRPKNQFDNQAMRAVAWSPDGKLLAVGTSYGVVLVWEADTGKLLAEARPGHPFLSASYDWVAFGDSPRSLFTSCRDWVGGKSRRTVYRCDLDPATGKLGNVETVALPPESGSWLAVHPGGRRFLEGGRIARLWGMEGTPLAEWRAHDKSLRAMAFSPDGKRFATMDNGRTVKTWATAAPDDARSKEQQPAGLCDFAVSPDERIMAVASLSPEMRPVGDKEHRHARVDLLDAATGKRIRVLEETSRLHSLATGTGGYVHRVGFSPDSRRVAVVDCDAEALFQHAATRPPGPARVFDISNGKELLRVEAAGEQVAFSPDGRWLATLALARGKTVYDLDRAAVMHFHDAKTGKRLFSHEDGGHRTASFAWSPDGSLVALAGRNRVTVLGVGGTGAEKKYALPVGAACLAFSPSGRLLATSAGRGDVRVWEADSGRLYAHIDEARDGGGGGAGSFQMLTYSPLWLAFTPDGSRLAYATPLNTVRLWSVERKQDVLVLEDFPTPIDRLRFDREGNRLFAVDSRPQWHVWDATPLPEERLYGRASRKLVEGLAAKFGLADEMAARLQADQEAPPGLRRVALRALEDFRENGFLLNTLAWDVAVAPGRTADEYRLAVRQAERAAELEGESQGTLNTLGAACYRAGEYAKARTALEKSQAKMSAEERDKAAEDLVFLAMTFHRLGDGERARAYLGKTRALREAKRSPSDQAEFLALLREAEGLIEGR